MMSKHPFTHIIVKWLIALAVPLLMAFPAFAQESCNAMLPEIAIQANEAGMTQHQVKPELTKAVLQQMVAEGFLPPIALEQIVQILYWDRPDGVFVLGMATVSGCLKVLAPYSMEALDQFLPKPS